ncbi:MAG TPA: DUF2203 domain-containing protein [Pyrinomonadaceae bacterium]|nr:DUF2203 domain-containing protein [Pyrinomonadaceae bacterium]
MRLFSVEEANELLPTVRLIVGRIARAHAEVLRFQAAAKRAAEGAEHGGGFMPGGTRYVAALLRLIERASELEALGVQLKDFARGLIDFPSLRDGRVVLLCWELGEGDRIEWWHETEAGYAGRQPL